MTTLRLTAATWAVALLGLGLVSLLAGYELAAVFRPRASWKIDNVYGGSPDDTDPAAYFAFNQATAWADPFLLAPLQIAGSIGPWRQRGGQPERRRWPELGVAICRSTSNRHPTPGQAADQGFRATSAMDGILEGPTSDTPQNRRSQAGSRATSDTTRPRSTHP